MKEVGDVQKNGLLLSKEIDSGRWRFEADPIGVTEQFEGGFVELYRHAMFECKADASRRRTGREEPQCELVAGAVFGARKYAPLEFADAQEAVIADEMAG